MLSKLTEIESIPDQSQYLTQLLEKGAKNSKQFIDQLNEDMIVKLQKKISKQNFELWLQLAIIMLSIQQNFEYASSPKQFSYPLLKLVDIIGALDVQDKHQKVAKILSKYSGLQTSIMLHTFLAKHCVMQVNENKFPRLIPIFIRLSSFIIQKFLQLKNQPAKGSQDRIEDDKVILKCCEGWVAHNIITFFSSLKQPSIEGNKKIVLMSICDIIGALLQINRQNIINKEIIQKLLQESLLKYCRNHYSWEYIYETYMHSLKRNKFNNPIKKIEIPQLYTEQQIQRAGLNTQAYAYIMINLVRSELIAVASQNTLLQIMIPLVAEIVSRPYQIKLQAIYLLQTTLALKTPIKIKSGFEYNFPIQLLFFNMFNFQNQKYESIRKSFIFQNQQIVANSLLLLKLMNLENLIKQKDKYILKIITKQDLIDPKIIIILNKFKLKQQKQKIQTLLLQIAVKLKQKSVKGVIQLIKKWKEQMGQKEDEKVRQKINSLLK